MANSSRKLKHRVQEKHGWPNTFSGRSKSYDYGGGWEYLSKPSHVTIKWTMIEYTRQYWRS